MQTYWLELSSRGDSSSQMDTASSSGGSETRNGLMEDDAPMTGLFDAKTVRLIEWNSDVLLRLLKQIVAQRKACPLRASEKAPPNESQFASGKGLNTLDEVKEIITLPKFKEAKKKESPEDIALEPEVVQQLHETFARSAPTARVF